MPTPNTGKIRGMRRCSHTLIEISAIIFVSAILLHDLHISPVSALAIAGSDLASASEVPEFYSKIQSPLAKIAVQHALNGETVPAILDLDLPENESLLATILLNNKSNTGSCDDDNANNGVCTGMNTCSDKHNISTTPSMLTAIATFAGGCFWGIQLAYDREPGVLATCVGYTQGTPLSTYPTYSAVCAEETGHTEACLVAFDPALVSYSHLANLMFDRIPDPTMLNRVGKDRGTQYRTGLYAHSDEQLVEAQAAFEKEDRSWFGRQVVTEVKLAGPFWPAEEEHQRYLEKGGRFGRPQSSEKGSKDEIRCYG